MIFIIWIGAMTLFMRRLRTVSLLTSCLIRVGIVFFFFFFQAEDGIRDLIVTGVQTCALPISWGREAWFGLSSLRPRTRPRGDRPALPAARRNAWRGRDRRATRQRRNLPRRAEIGRASCRERV